MGVPAFFRWLSRRYPSIVVHCVEEKPKELDGVKVPVDSSQPNPNDIELDNLYLDMNGIIHPCTHPEDKPAPKNEAEMMVAIFEYIDRIFSIVRPRRLLYMAIDGVAPRAKMNQQRSRRFRASKETSEKVDDIARIRSELESNGATLPPPKAESEHFDSNCITPGTPFMFRLAECLRYYIHDRLNNDPGWRQIEVILSDANVPGEGEHKIMDYIRKQRAQPDHDPNTHHCLCGADADLIMLGLATHEVNFTIIREEFKPNKPRNCEICGQVGHEMKECTGAAKEKEGEFDELSKEPVSEQEFIFLRLNVLREYLEKELRMDHLPFPYDFDRALDDWVFMCFFVGNDFLPHLPSLEIRENAIDRLIRLYKDAVRRTGGFLTDSGVVNLARVQLILTELGKVEDDIFRNRRERDVQFKQRDKDKKKRMKSFENAKRPTFAPGGQYAPKAPSSNPSAISNPRQEAYMGRVQAANYSTSTNSANQGAAAELRAMLRNGEESGPSTSQGQKRKAEGDESDDEPNDEVRLWEDGWKSRYYQSKFDVDADDEEFRRTVGREYVIGLCWVLRYYYQGCPSWKWYFPYHYAPFASDFVNISDLPNDFETTTGPFNPLEQLMGVFPAGSKQHLPITWQRLMCDPESPIIDQYPSDFKIDLNGKRYAWQGVALLPFVDEKRMLAALEMVYPDLTPEERSRNIRGDDRLFVSRWHPAADFIDALYEGSRDLEPVEIDAKLTHGIRGSVWCDKLAIMMGDTIPSPLPQCRDLEGNNAIGIQFKDPQYPDGFLFPARILPGANPPPPSLKPEDFAQMGRGRGGFRGRGGYRPQLGFTRDSGYRNPLDKDVSSGLRMIRHGMDRPQGGGGVYGNVPPPLMSGRPSGRGSYNQDNSRQDRDRNRSYSGSSRGRGGGYDGNYGNQYAGSGNNNRGGYGNQGRYGNQGGYGGSPGGGYGAQGQQGYRGGGQQHYRTSSAPGRGSRNYRGGYPAPPNYDRY